MVLGSSPRATSGEPPCPPDMADVEGGFCIDRFEAHLERVQDSGAGVRAVSRAGVMPQAYISREQAAEACREAGKRLCSKDEWQAACKGPTPTTYPYGSRWREGYCNDHGVDPLTRYYGSEPTERYGFEAMNDPRLNEVVGGLSRTGHFAACQNGYGVRDMVGNLHEWTAESEGVFRGGFYLDTDGLGEGCDYAARGHQPTYRDYSIGFRCCADPR